MKIACPRCKANFDASPAQARLITSLKAKGAALAMVECTQCFFDFGLELTDQTEPDKPIRCPVKACGGWVSCVTLKGRTPFYGCGECGTIWKQANLLFDAVASTKKGKR